MMTLNAGGIQLVKVVGSQIGVGFLLPQDMGNDHQQTVGDGDNGLLSSSPLPHLPLLFTFLCQWITSAMSLERLKFKLDRVSACTR
jgi:hypothetical protein